MSCGDIMNGKVQNQKKMYIRLCVVNEYQNVSIWKHIIFQVFILIIL